MERDLNPDPATSGRARDDAAAKAARLASHLLTLQLDDELDSLRQELDPAGGHVARTLVKRDDLGVVLIAMTDGARLPTHHARASVTIQTLSGRVVLHADGDEIELPAGALIVLEPGLRHALEATEDAAVLLTLAR